MTGRTRIASCLLLLGAFVVLESCTSVDMVVQHLLYTENHWLITQAMHNTGLALWFYQGPKACIAIFGVLCLSGVGAALSRPTLFSLQLLERHCRNSIGR